MKSNRGFTLMEMLIVVALISILSAIGISSYKRYIEKGNRSAVQATLMESANSLERFKTQNFTYTGADAQNLVPSQSPSTGVAKYTIAMPATAITGGGTAYEITATSTTAFNSSQKEVLKINSAGQRCISALAAASSNCTYGTDKTW